MCGRFTIIQSIDELCERFQAQFADIDFLPRYNVAPTESVPIVINAKRDKETGLSPGRSVEMVRWGLVPSWSKDAKSGARMINARGEELAEKSTFRTPLASRRCIVPVSGFYEWKDAGERRKKTDPPRQPMYAHPVDADIFALAGLWDIWRQPDGEWLKTFTIITVPPNDVLAEIHDRMPAILRPEDEALWMDPSVTDPALVLPLLQTAPADWMDVYPVSPKVNTAGVDDPAFIERVDAVPVGLFDL